MNLKNKIMRQLLFVITISLFFISCKKKQQVVVVSQKAKINIDVNSIKKLTCEDVFLELIKSSNFPFKKNSNNKNLSVIIDEFDKTKIIGKLIFKTDGTGTLGWVNLNFKERKLYNESAYLETPVPLSFNKEILNILLKNCNIVPVTLAKKDTITSNYKINNLPISYNYENDFMQIQLPVAWASLKLNASFEDAFIALLPKLKEYQPVIFTGVNSFGNSEEYLVVLNNKYKEISRIRLYYNDAPDGNIESYSYATYQIKQNYTIKITVYKVKEDLEKNEIIEKKASDIYYTINHKGIIVKK